MKLKLQLRLLYRLNGQENRSNKCPNVLRLNANFKNWPTDTQSHTHHTNSVPSSQLKPQVLNVISALSPRGLEMELESYSDPDSELKLLKRARKTNKMLLVAAALR